MSSQLNDRAAESSTIVAAAGLVYVSDAMAGIRRVRTADGFVYLLPNDRRLTDEVELKASRTSQHLPPMKTCGSD
jgi:DNA topoisomerase IB